MFNWGKRLIFARALSGLSNRDGVYASITVGGVCVYRRQSVPADLCTHISSDLAVSRFRVTEIP